MFSKLYNSHSIAFVIPEIVTNKPLFILLAHQMTKKCHFLYLQDGVGDHFEYGSVKKVPITFQRHIGAIFSLKLS